MSFSIVETNTAKIIWEATADGIYTTGTASGKAPIKDTIDLAMQTIKENIPLL